LRQTLLNTTQGLDYRKAVEVATNQETNDMALRSLRNTGMSRSYHILNLIRVKYARKPHQLPYVLTESPDKPFDRIALDVFHYRKHKFLTAIYVLG
jgi:hypothetical protein